MRRMILWVLAVVVATAAPIAQQRDPGVDQLIAQYQDAWNKGEAKALASLYTENALRVTDQGQVRGRQAIQQMFERNFAGAWKGTKVKVTTEHTESLTADVQLSEGTFEVSGGSTPQRGRFLNTVVRQGGQWRIAGLAAFPQTQAPK